MAGDTVLTIVGNLTADPELRFIPSGAAVANFTVASTPRTFDKQTNEWKDGETLFMRCNAWRDLGENIAESLRKGMRVVVTGRLQQRSYTTKEGENRTVVELDVDECGPSLRNATAQVRKTERQQGQQQGQQQGGWGAQQTGDPWATNPQGAPQQGGWAQGGQMPPGPAQQPPQQGGWGQPPAQPPQQGGWGHTPAPYDQPPFAFPATVIDGETPRARRWH